MDDRFNIENSLRNLFEEFRIEPSKELWDNISSELDKKSEKKYVDDIENIAGLFENYRLTPSAKVWQGIVAMLDTGTTGTIFSRIFASRFSRVTLNILLALITLFSISYIPSARKNPGSGANLPAQITVTEVKVATHNHNSTGRIIKSSPENKLNPAIVSTKKISKENTVNNHNTVSISNPKILPVQTNGNNTYITAVENPSNKSISNPAINPSNQALNTNKVETVEIPDIKIEKPAVTLLINHNNSALRLSKSSQHSFSISPVPSGVLKYDLPDKSRSGEFYGLRDTFFIDWLNKFRHRKIYDWYAGVNFMPKYSTSTVITNDAVYFDPLEKFKETETPNPGYKIGLTFGHFTRKQYLIETGFSYEFRQTYAQYNLVFNQTDTSILIGHDSTGAIQIDTNISNQKVHLVARSTNQHKIIEIPLLVGYRYPWKESVLIIKTGLIAGIPVSNNIQLNSVDGIYIENLPYPTLNSIHWSWLFTAEYSYSISEHAAIMIAPVFRIPINSVYKDYPIQHKFYSWGLNAGVYYYFKMR